MTISVEGKVEAVSKKFDGGLLISGKWYNGSSTTSEQVKSMRWNSEVRLNLDEKGKIISVEVTKEGDPPRNQEPHQESSGASNQSKDDYWKNKFEYEKSKNERDHWRALTFASIEVVKNSQKEYTTPAASLDDITNTAEALNNFIEAKAKGETIVPIESIE